MNGAYLTLKGKHIYYESENGDLDRTVIMLHGMRFSSADWVKIDALRKISQWGFNVIAVDYPGFGRSDSNAEYSITGEDYSSASRFVSDFCLAQGARHFTLIGPSMGGAIAIRAAIDGLSELERVIAVAPAGFSSFRERLSRIEVPVHLVWGTDDRVIDLSYGRRYHDLIAGSTLSILRGVGHPLYIEKPAQFFSLIKKFLVDGS